MVSLSYAASDDNLAEGSPAPALTVAKWVKGTPVKAFEPGKVYVVEFWATWCGPCIQAMPHLTELAKKYKGQATFVGVNVWDKDEDKTSLAYIDRIEKWVKANKDMGYNVCIDDVKDTMATTWMKAAKQNGIPASFVIDQKGTIAWIGHPMGGLDEVLPKVIAGNFDVEEAKKMREAAAAKQAEIQQLFKDASALVKEGKVDEGWAKLDEVAKKEPEYAKYMPIYKFDMLAESDEAKATELARGLLKNPTKDDAACLGAIGQNIGLGYTKMKSPDYALASELVRTAIKLQGKDNPYYLMADAEAQFKLGNKADAIKIIEKAIKMVKAEAGSNPKQVAMFEEKLKAYKD